MRAREGRNKRRRGEVMARLDELLALEAMA
jgi:hypothetical protein